MEELNELAIKKLEERGVTIRDISKIAKDLQDPYSNVTLEECDVEVIKVINRHESVSAILTGIAIDEMAEKKLMDKEIAKIIVEDDSLYGIDEIVALSIVNMFGSIALTNFGYVDKIKPGIIGVIDRLGKEGKACHTFLDDIVGAIAAGAASKIAHSEKYHK